MSECIHKEVVTFRTEAGEPVPLWACSKCKTRFEPIGPWMEREKSLQARIEALEDALHAILGEEVGFDETESLAKIFIVARQALEGER